jgi:uncharacterized repeat protein (TIGR01451 family)
LVGDTADGGLAVFQKEQSQADLSIKKDDGVTSVVAGGTTTYTIVASNLGPGAVTGATVSDRVPAGVISANWSVTGVTGGATVSSAMSGAGNLTATLNLPANSSVTFIFTVSLSPSFSGPLINTATIAMPAGGVDTNPANNSATDTDTIVASGISGAYTGPILVYGTDAGLPGEVRVFNPTTLALIWDFFPYGPNFRGGVHVAAGDVNSDGIQDIITGPGAGGGPLVNVYNGFNLQLLKSFNAYNPNFLNGVFVAVGDINADGFADIITAPDAGGGPLVEAFDGATGNMLIAFNAYDPSFRGGVHVAAGDVTGDGRAEIVTGPGVGGGPLVEVFNAANGKLLVAFNAYNPAFLGGAFVATADLNGDGRDEIVTGPGVGGGSLVNLFDGGTGQMLLSFNTYNPLFIGGVRVGSLRDLNGNGSVEILTGGGPGGALMQQTNTGLAATIPAQVYDGALLSLLDQASPFGRFFFGGYFVAGSR